MRDNYKWNAVEFVPPFLVWTIFWTPILVLLCVSTQISIALIVSNIDCTNVYDLVCQEFEKYFNNPDYVIVNVPPNFMFRAKVSVLSWELIFTCFMESYYYMELIVLACPICADFQSFQTLCNLSEGCENWCISCVDLGTDACISYTTIDPDYYLGITMLNCW
jgi:hypothetical protein